MTVSVIIPCYNAAPWIRQTLESVAQQAVGGLETIVVDDGSTDGSAEIVRQVAPGARMVQTSRRGPSHARNTGTAQATGEFLQYLDADDLLTPGKISTQLTALTQQHADVAYGDWQALIPDGDAHRPGRLVQRQLAGDPEVALFTDFWCPPAAYLFRRTIVERVGGWPLGLPIIQDARFALDCALHGGRFVYCPGIMAYYRVHHGESVSRQDPRAFVQDCLTNAMQVEQWWQQHGGITEPRRRALVHVYGSVARGSFRRDPPTFESAYQTLERLQPGYTPETPWHLALASRLVGYRHAEAFAWAWRRVKAAGRRLALWKPS